MNIPKGAVGIAGMQTGVYPISTPGGWQLIGQTPSKLFLPNESPPSLLQAGDKVKFIPISSVEYKEIARKGGVKMSMRVIKPGLLTSIQDLGRKGFQQHGVIVSGAMDPYSLRIANMLVGNEEGEAALEITLLGPTLIIEKDCLIAITGGNLSPTINGEAVPMWRPIFVKKGAVLAFCGCQSGCRAYLSVAGGYSIPSIMNSKSTYLRAGMGGYKGRALQVDDV